MELPLPPPPPPPPAPPRFLESGHRLRRSRSQRMLGGVAGGIAETYGWDVALVRLAWVIAAVLGIGAPAYVVAWIVIPPETGPGQPAETDTRETGGLIGLLLLGIGVLWLGHRFVPRGPDFVDMVWPVALIAGGIAVLALRARNRESEWPPRPEDTSTRPTDDRPTDGTPTPTYDASPAAPTAAGADELDDDTDVEHTTTSAWVQRDAWPHAWPLTAPPSPPPFPRPRRPRPFLGPIVLSLLLIGAGVVALLDTTNTAEIDIEVAFAIALGAVGLALLTTAWWGRARGLIPLGIALTAALGVMTVVDVPFEGGIGERTHRPTNVQELRSEYHLAIGHLTLDLRDAPLVDRTTEVKATLALGKLQVQVPSDVTVEVDAEAGAGNILLFGREADGWDIEDALRARGEEAGVLRLDLEIGAGSIQVDRYSAEDIETIPEGSR